MNTATQLDSITCMDGLQFMASLEPQSIDAIITDLPYGTTRYSWDRVIPFEPMWDAVRRVLKPQGVFVTTASGKFAHQLVMSNAAGYRHEWVWVKSLHTNFANARKQPLRKFEQVLVFGGSTYYPQGLIRIDKVVRNSRSTGGQGTGAFKYGAAYTQKYTNYPKGVLDYPSETHRRHPSQKPVALVEYLIKTYTQPGEVVLDFCCGSGTTAVAARNTGRHWICSDIEPDHVAMAVDRLALQSVTDDLDARTPESIEV